MKLRNQSPIAWHPDHHILPALFSLNDALKIALRDGPRARKLAWEAIKHGEIAGMSNLVASAQALLGAIKW